MALAEISEELHAECTELNTVCIVHGDEIARLTRLHAAEVVSLRRKIDALESSLAVAEVARAAEVVSLQANPPLTSISFGGPSADGKGPAASERDQPTFVSSQEPAVVSVVPAAHRINGTDASAVQPHPPSTEDAARPPAVPEDVWADTEASFEERMAAREFFADAPGGQEPRWRRWLLKKA